MSRIVIIRTICNGASRFAPCYSQTRLVEFHTILPHVEACGLPADCCPTHPMGVCRHVCEYGSVQEEAGVCVCAGMQPPVLCSLFLVAEADACSSPGHMLHRIVALFLGTFMGLQFYFKM